MRSGCGRATRTIPAANADELARVALVRALARQPTAAGELVACQPSKSQPSITHSLERPASRVRVARRNLTGWMMPDKPSGVRHTQRRTVIEKGRPRTLAGAARVAPTCIPCKRGQAIRIDGIRPVD